MLDVLAHETFEHDTDERYRPSRRAVILGVERRVERDQWTAELGCGFVGECRKNAIERVPNNDLGREGHSTIAGRSLRSMGIAGSSRLRREELRTARGNRNDEAEWKGKADP